MSTIRWDGRIYVSEHRISPEQYKNFFDIKPNAISYSMVNRILAQNSMGDLRNIVSAYELNNYTRQKIFNDVMRFREKEGTVFYAGEDLNWKWYPTIVIDGKEVMLEDVDNASLDTILSQMLFNGYHWGRGE